ncbi:MAG: tRNA uridine-5-carboxymethylaminomethyl(34) synthesis GTPase MnmE [Verrucomicrobiota bacterium]
MNSFPKRVEDTIAAICTPLGESGLAVIRLSGPDAATIADRCFAPARPGPLSAATTHTLHYGHVRSGGVVIDEVLAAVMRAPRTFTREDVVEISCHGGMLPAKQVLDALLSAGARLAEPGEFTRRAFLNGRLDLAQAEAVADLIHARTELSLRAAQEQLAGKLSRRIDALRDDLVRVLAHVEAHIDFPDEDLAPDTREQLRERTGRALAALGSLLATASEGRILRNGIRAVILGRPNAGKSSLLNQLLGHDRAIVSPIPGTTRDTIEEMANIRGIPVRFIDTAGLREGRDDIEREGIRRSREMFERAEVLLHVLDRSEPFTPEDGRLLSEGAGRKRVLVLNKSDLPPRLELPSDLAAPAVPVCSLSGEGLETLKDALASLVWSGQVRGDMLEVMINARHQNALERARQALESTRQALSDGKALEIVAMELRIAVNAVGEVVGKTTTEDLLDSIFSQFCIGK